jgi:hypothetical protein
LVPLHLSESYQRTTSTQADLAETQLVDAEPEPEPVRLARLEPDPTASSTSYTDFNVFEQPYRPINSEPSDVTKLPDGGVRIGSSSIPRESQKAKLV